MSPGIFAFALYWLVVSHEYRASVALGLVFDCSVTPLSFLDDRVRRLASSCERPPDYRRSLDSIESCPRVKVSERLRLCSQRGRHCVPRCWKVGQTCALSGNTPCHSRGQMRTELIRHLCTTTMQTAKPKPDMRTLCPWLFVLPHV